MKKTLAHTAWECKYQIVWIPKNRERKKGTDLFFPRPWGANAACLMSSNPDFSSVKFFADRGAGHAAGKVRRLVHLPSFEPLDVRQELTQRSQMLQLKENQPCPVMGGMGRRTERSVLHGAGWERRLSTHRGVDALGAGRARVAEAGTHAGWAVGWTQRRGPWGCQARQGGGRERARAVVRPALCPYS